MEERETLLTLLRKATDVGNELSRVPVRPLAPRQNGEE